MWMKFNNLELNKNFRFLSNAKNIQTATFLSNSFIIRNVSTLRWMYRYSMQKDLPPFNMHVESEKFYLKYESENGFQISFFNSNECIN